MRNAALLLTLCAPVRAQAPETVVARVMARAEVLVAAQGGLDAGEIGGLDRRAEELSRELKPLGWKAIPALVAAAQDPRRPAKVRLLAVSFLALTRDPAALAPLEDILLDKDQPAVLRSVAAQSLPGLGAPDAAARRALCAALEQEDLPREVLAEAAAGLSRLGCPDPTALARLARSFGPRPGPKDAPLLDDAIDALERSPGRASDEALRALASYFPPRSDARALVLEARARRALITPP